ncbi:Auxin_canalis domain-containing protein/PH_2 domain-containing protein [Cephalotus follicularis]|uniref:Auxin_canalis domain-containing protein/PH_2 domain-containing protein n=1 Tax=Cephalotus follicularis TaxID=3775 RepID=A0A1Q3D134_CEPFO|nr:Auxin_canalis domain-containing protein/PH_2 domain-containing protein [Cephalotus follicularis]
MDSNFKPTPSEAHPDTMDFLSNAWCNFAVQALQPELHNRSIIFLDNSMNKFDSDPITPLEKMDKLQRDDSDFQSIPSWKSNDVKSWIWMQQAMHPELNYNSSLGKKWLPWKMVSIKKLFKERKLKQKEEERLQRAEVHAAISVAGLAAALAAIAAETSKKDDPTTTTKEAAAASAAALVAAQCAKVAEAMGAKREQLSSVIGSAMSGTSASDILTLTAAATTSLKGAATLQARAGCKTKINGSTPLLPIVDNNDIDFDFNKCKSILAKGAELSVGTPNGKYMVRSVSIILNTEAKVILKLRKLNLLKSKKQSIVLDLHAEWYKDHKAEDNDTCYLIVLSTTRGTIKLDMADDYQRYKKWAKTINHMLMISTSFTKYENQF